MRCFWSVASVRPRTTTPSMMTCAWCLSSPSDGLASAEEKAGATLVLTWSDDAGARGGSRAVELSGTLFLAWTSARGLEELVRRCFNRVQSLPTHCESHPRLGPPARIEYYEPPVTGSVRPVPDRFVQAHPVELKADVGARDPRIARVALTLSEKVDEWL